MEALAKADDAHFPYRYPVNYSNYANLDHGNSWLSSGGLLNRVVHFFDPNYGWGSWAHHWWISVYVVLRFLRPAAIHTIYTRCLVQAMHLRIQHLEHNLKLLP